jgi:preprotein translocase subunit SecG
MIETLLLLAHLVVAGLIIALVLLQRGKGAEAGTGFGAGASGTVFGSRGSANFFSRATAVLATLFFATSLTLAWFATRTTASDGVLEGSVVQGAGLETGDAPAVLPAPGEAPAEVPAVETLPPGDIPSLDEEPAGSTGGVNE